MFKASISYFLIRAINGALGLAAVFILTRIMSAEQYGAYALGLATITLCASVFFQWIAVAIARFYAAHANAPEDLISEGNRLFFVTSIFALVLMFFYLLWIHENVEKIPLILIVGVGVIGTGLHNLRLQIANARGRPLSYATLTISRAAFALCATVLFVKLGYGALGAIFGFAIGSILSTALFRSQYIAKNDRSDKEIRQKIISYGLPLTLTYFSTMVLDVSDRFMIGWWLGTPAVAGYAAAYDLTQQIIGAIMNVLLLASYPRITSAWERGGASEAKQAMSPLSQTMLLGTPLLAGIFIGGANEISNFAFGQAVREDAAQVIPWISFAIAVGCFKSYFLDIAFQLAKTTRIQLNITFAMAAINVLFNLALMPTFGIVGAAISTAIAFTVGAILSWWYGRGLCIYPSKKLDALKMFLVLAATVAAMYYAPANPSELFIESGVRLFFGLLAYVSSVAALDLAKARSLIIAKIKSRINE